MASYIQTLMKGNDEIIPRTRSSAVTMADGTTTLENALSAKAETFKATITRTGTDPNYTFTSNKTFAEIVAAYNAGKIVIATCTFSGDDYSYTLEYSLTEVDSDYLVLTSTGGDWYHVIGIDSENVIDATEGNVGSVNGASIENNPLEVSNSTIVIPLANSSSAGVIKSGNGVVITNGVPSIEKAQNASIGDRVSSYNPIVPSNLNYAVKAALTDTNHVNMSTAEQTTAREVLGAGSATKLTEVELIAKGAQKAYAISNYQTLVSTLNAAAVQTLNVGQSIYVQTLNVPDVWIYSNNESTSVPYTYTTDDALVTALKSGAVQMGYHKIAMLETAKVDLSGYSTTAQIETMLDTETVRVDKTQTFSTEQKTQARTNINAEVKIPTVYITAEKIISQNPIKIQLTDEDAAILENTDYSFVRIDSSTLGGGAMTYARGHAYATSIQFTASSYGQSNYVPTNTALLCVNYVKATKQAVSVEVTNQKRIDYDLTTTNKTVVGAINEIKGDLVNLDNAKVDKVQGKGLSTNDFDNTEKAKADGAVRFDTAMGLSDAQKLQARANIGILATLTVSCKPSEVGDSTVLSGVAVTIKDGGDNTIASGTFNGTALTFPLPINQQYKVVVSATVSIGGVVYFNPQGVGSEGAMTTDKTVVMEYASTRNIQTMADVKTFLALDLPIETKRNALVASETNSFTFNVDLYGNGTEVAKTATMPMRVLEVDTYEQMVDGETVSFVGAKCQPIYTVTDKVFDQREQVETSAGETFTADLRYFTATTGGVGDKAFTMLTAGTDYQVGDDIDTYKTAHNVFVYKNGLRNNSNQLSADASVVRYGSNITHLSNVHKWLNGEGLDWFESSYVGDICNYSGTLGYKSWFKSDALSLIRDNVAWGVYERSGYELPNNKMYCMFALPSVTEFAGSGNSYEGTATGYWKYLNGGAISNAANATRVIKNSGGTNKYMWFRSPSRSYSYYPWYLRVSGSCNSHYAFTSYGVAPLFVI